jgi:hypothetical protein
MNGFWIFICPRVLIPKHHSTILQPINIFKPTNAYVRIQGLILSHNKAYCLSMYYESMTRPLVENGKSCFKPLLIKTVYKYQSDFASLC